MNHTSPKVSGSNSASKSSGFVSSKNNSNQASNSLGEENVDFMAREKRRRVDFEVTAPHAAHTSLSTRNSVVNNNLASACASNTNANNANTSDNNNNANISKHCQQLIRIGLLFRNLLIGTKTRNNDNNNDFESIISTDVWQMDANHYK